ncbi:MAG: AAA family ATPase [Candidatus Pacearchaeota archaeon]
MGKVIGIVSFKGGVGKTISAINIAAALSKRGEKVLVVDVNFLSPTLHIYLGLLDPDVTLREIIKYDMLPEDAIYEHETGIHIMPCNFCRDMDCKIFKTKIDELKKKYDFIILDSGPSYTREIFAILAAVDEVIFITTPDYPTLVTTLRSAEFMRSKNIAVGGVLLNKYKKKRHELSRKDIENATRLPVIAEIRDNNKIMKSFSKFMPVTHSFPRNKNSKRYLKLAEYLVDNNLTKDETSELMDDAGEPGK